MESLHLNIDFARKTLEIENCQNFEFNKERNGQSKTNSSKGLSEEKSSEKSTKCNITLRNSTDSKPHSLFNNKSSIFTDKENLQKILILKLLEKNIIADMYQNAVLNLLDSKINADLMREIDLQEITNYFEEVEDKLISKKKQRDEVGLKIRCKKSKGKLRSLKSAN